MKHILPDVLALTLALTLAGASQASAVYLAENGMTVTGTADSFTVKYKPGRWLADYWCAAGDYAVGMLRRSPAETLYRVTTQDPKNLGGVEFSVLAERSSGDAGLNIVGKDDGGIPAAMAQQYCESRRHIFGED